MMKLTRGFTLVELMVAVAVVAVLLTLAAPAFYDFILVQRLKSINAQLVTDMQFARSEAVSHVERRPDDPTLNVDVRVLFVPAAPGAAMSCYSIYTDSSADPRFKCDCTQPPGMRCAAVTTREIRTVQIPTSLGVRLSLPDGQPRDFAYMPTTGAILIGAAGSTGESPDFQVETSIDATRKLSTRIGLSGRPTVCAPGGAVTGSTPC